MTDQRSTRHMCSIIISLGLIFLPLHSLQAAEAHASGSAKHPSCRTHELQKAVHAYASSIHMRFQPRTVNCDEGWAVLGGELIDPHAPVDGPQGVGTSLIFQSIHGLWKHQDAQAVCGTLNPEKLDERPRDALIPKALFFLGCLVG